MSGLYTRFVANLLFPLHERLKQHDTVAVHRALEQSQWYAADELAALQLRALQRLLQEAYDKTAYYRQVMDEAGLHPTDVNGLDDLTRLPFLTKSLIRAHSDDLKASDAVGLSQFNTGGSSGEPLIFHIGSERVSHDVAAKWRATRWWGVDIGDPEVVIWGSPVELGAQDHLRVWRDRLLRSHLIPAFEMSKQNLDHFVSEIRRIKPAMLFGYPSSLSVIARHAESMGVAMNDLGIRVAFVTSERLYDQQRDDIERVFGCPVANGYGGRDAGFIAHQCPEGGMHITAEDIIVEIIDSEGRVLPPGEAGEVVVTHLATRDFPFIRYRTGDVAVRDEQPCACGRGLPLLKEIHGRTTDFIVAADGTLMHGLALIYVLREQPQIAAFKIIQESLALTRVLIVPGADYTPAVGTIIREGLQKRLGETVEIQVETVAEIPRERSGKFRYVVSKVSA